MLLGQAHRGTAGREHGGLGGVHVAAVAVEEIETAEAHGEHRKRLAAAAGCAGWLTLCGADLEVSELELRSIVVVEGWSRGHVGDEKSKR